MVFLKFCQSLKYLKRDLQQSDRAFHKQCDVKYQMLEILPRLFKIHSARSNRFLNIRTLPEKPEILNIC